MSVWESYGTSMNVILSFGKKNKPQETPKFVNKDKPHLSICLPLLYLCIWVQRTALRCITRLEWMIFGGWCHFSALSVLYVHLLYLNMTTIGMRKIPVQVQMPQITLEALRLMFAPSQCTHPTRIHGYLFVGCRTSLQTCCSHLLSIHVFPPVVQKLKSFRFIFCIYHTNCSYVNFQN